MQINNQKKKKIAGKPREIHTKNNSITEISSILENENKQKIPEIVRKFQADLSRLLPDKEDI